MNGNKIFAGNLESKNGAQAFHLPHQVHGNLNEQNHVLQYQSRRASLPRRQGPAIQSLIQVQYLS